MQMIEVSKLKHHPRNTEFFDDITGDKWKDFKKSIIRRGVVEGVVITQDLVIVSGHQRVRACKELGIVEIPCRITHYPDKDERTGNTKEDMILEDLISTNIIQRGIGNVNPMKMAKCIVELERIYGIRAGSAGGTGVNQYITKLDKDNLNQAKTQADLASQIGISQQQLQDYKKLNTLIPELQELVETGRLKATTGYKIWAKMPKEEQEKLLEEIGIKKVSGLTQKETDRLIKEKQQLELEKKNLESELKNRPIIEKEKIIESEVYPKDYHQLKNELQMLKQKSTEPIINIKQNKKTNVNKNEFYEKYRFKINEFEETLQQCSVAINPFIFMDNIYKKMDTAHKRYLISEVEKLEEELGSLKNQIIFYGGIVNE